MRTPLGLDAADFEVQCWQAGILEKMNEGAFLRLGVGTCFKWTFLLFTEQWYVNCNLRI